MKVEHGAVAKGNLSYLLAGCLMSKVKMCKNVYTFKKKLHDIQIANFVVKYCTRISNIHKKSRRRGMLSLQSLKKERRAKLMLLSWNR